MTRKTRAGAGLTAVIGWMTVTAFGASVAAEAAGPEFETTVVEGKSLKELRKDVKKAEDRFRKTYNDLNQDSQQRISCEDDAATGTRFKKRTCTTQAMHAATSDQITQSLSSMQLNASVAGQTPEAAALEAGGSIVDQTAMASRAGGEPTQFSSISLQAERDAFEKNVQKLMAEHPELRKRYDEYVQARARLDAAESRASKPVAAPSG